MTQLTVPSPSSRAWERLRDSISAELHNAVDRLPPRRREQAIDAASIPSIRYERYRRNGITRVRKARGG